MTIFATMSVWARRLIPMIGALVVGGFALSLAPRGAIEPPWLLWIVAGAALAWVARQPPGVRRDDVLPACAVLLSALGLLVTARISADLAHRQVCWTAFSLVLVAGGAPALERFRVLSGYRYIWVLGAIVLFALTALFGEEVNGAKLWIRLGPLQFEPVEVIKLFMVLFMAGYLAETADVIAAAKPWSLHANAKYLGPLFIGWGVSTAILVLQHDLGMAVLLLLIFLAMLYVAARRLDLVFGAGLVFSLAAAFAIRTFPYMRARVEAWRHPFADPYGGGYQALHSLFSLAAGGLFGTGYTLGHPTSIPSAATDYAYAAWSEEFGALGALVLLGAYLVLVRRMLSVAQRVPDLYGKLLATGLAATLGFQVFVIVGGILGLFPLTGITLPFFSYGGSSLVANYVLVALLWAVGGVRVVRGDEKVLDEGGQQRVEVVGATDAAQIHRR
jgi:cell division protein FtsW (lipid II flippase)